MAGSESETFSFWELLGSDYMSRTSQRDPVDRDTCVQVAQRRTLKNLTTDSSVGSLEPLWFLLLLSSQLQLLVYSILLHLNHYSKKTIVTWPFFFLEKRHKQYLVVLVCECLHFLWETLTDGRLMLLVSIFLLWLLSYLSLLLCMLPLQCHDGIFLSSRLGCWLGRDQ